MTGGPTLDIWLELLLVLGGEVALLVGVAAVLERLIRSAAWQRVLWQACLLGFPLLLLLELTGASRGAASLSESVLLEDPDGDHDPLAEISRITPVKQKSSRPAAAPPAVPAASRDPECPPWMEESMSHGERADDLEHSPGEARTRPFRPTEDAPRHPARSPGPARVSPSPPPSPPYREPGTWWPGLIWLAGSAAMASRRALGSLVILLFRRRELGVERQVEDNVRRLAGSLGIRGAVAVMGAPGLSSPIALGLLRPTIALPEGFTREYAPAHQEVILAHELAHLAGRDPAWLLAADLITACIWWHPLAWWARERLLKSCEAAADEASALFEDGPLALAACLVALGREKSKWAGASAGMRGGGFHSALGRRVERLVRLESGSWRLPGGFRSWAARVLGSSLVVSLSVIPLAWARPRAPGEPEEGGQEMSTMIRSFKRSLAGMALVAILGTGSEGSFSQDDPLGDPEAPALDGPGERVKPDRQDVKTSDDPAPAERGSPDLEEPYDEDTAKPKARYERGAKKRGATIEEQIMTQLQALSRRLDAIEKELGQKRGSSGFDNDFLKAQDSLKDSNEALNLLNQNLLKEQKKSADNFRGLLLQNTFSPGSGKEAVKWEYKVLSAFEAGGGTTGDPWGLSDQGNVGKGKDPFKMQAGNLEETLNELGSQGWELCAVTDHLYVFKRQAASPGSRK